MKTVTQVLYTYAIQVETAIRFKITDTAGMDGQGWHLVDEREISIDIEDLDYSDEIKQTKINAALAHQEKLNSELLEAVE